MSVAIVSGGADSVTMLHWLVRNLGQNPFVISFVYGQKHSKEINCALYHTKLLHCPHLVLDVTALAPVFAKSALTSSEVPIPPIEEVMGDPQPATYVPNRNMLFLALAVAYAETLGTNEVYYGAQKHDQYGYWDTTPDFLDRLNDTYALNRKHPIRIRAPFIYYTKALTIKTGLELEVDYSKTWSCYAGQEKACGVCPTCSERLAAFSELGVVDPLEYV